MDRKAWWTTVHGVASVGHDLAIKPPPPPPKIKIKPAPCVALIVGNSLTQTCLEYPGASGGGVGQQWPAAALGALSVGNVCTGPYEGGRRYLHYLPHSLVSGQTTGREHSPTQQQKIGLKIYWAWHPIRTRPSFPLSQSLPSGSFHKPLILHQRADRIENHNHGKLIKLIRWTTALASSIKLWNVLSRATQDWQVMVESSDKMRPPGEGNGKPLQYSWLENPMNRMKRQKSFV